MRQKEDQDVRWLTTKEKILIPFVIFLFVTLWGKWLQSSLYDGYLKNIPIGALWIIVLMLLTAILALVVTIRQKNKTLKKQASEELEKLVQNYNKTIGNLYALLASGPNDDLKFENLNSIFKVFQYGKNSFLDSTTQLKSGLEQNSMLTNQYQEKLEFINCTVNKNSKPTTLQELEIELLDYIKVLQSILEIEYNLLEHKLLK